MPTGGLRSGQQRREAAPAVHEMSGRRAGRRGAPSGAVLAGEPSGARTRLQGHGTRIECSTCASRLSHLYSGTIACS